MKKDKETDILYREWKANEPEAVFLLVHGLGAHAGRWESLADFFLQNNISSYALELKGFGKIEGLKGHIDSFDIYYDDVRSLRNIIAAENPGKKIFLLGESMGALISFVEEVNSPDLYDALICLAPVFASRLKISFLEYIKIFLARIFNPEKQFKLPFNSEMCTRDEYQRKIMNGDPLEHRRATPKLLFEILAAQIKAGMLKEKVELPVLFLLSGEDKLADPAAAEKIFKGLGSEDKELTKYPGMYHSLSVELGREEVFNDILKWVKGRI